MSGIGESSEGDLEMQKKMIFLSQLEDFERIFRELK